MADNWPFKATSKMEHTPNIPPVYRQRCETAALAWPLTKDFVCVFESAGMEGAVGTAMVFTCAVLT